MSFQVYDLHEQDLEWLSSQEESHFFEFKAADSFDPIGKSLSAFTNADGGRLIVGVSDAKQREERQAAYPTQEAANGHVTEIFKMFSDSPDSIRIAFFRFPDKGGYLMDVEVDKSISMVTTPSGEVFVRRNAQNIRLRAAQQIQELAWKKGQESYENVITEEPEDLADGSQTFGKFKAGIVPLVGGSEFLRREKLARQGKATVAGVLLFDDQPQATVTQSAAKLYRYKSVQAEGERETLAGDPVTLEGSLYNLIESAVSKTIAIIEEIEVLGKSGFEKIKYPKQAIHEVICNALIHRDFSIHDYVHIRVFDNRVEVESPGRLAGHVTVEKILGQRFARNKRTVRVLNKFPNPPNKDVGEGLNTAFDSMRKLNLREPMIEERENSVCVILEHEPLASKEKLVRDYLARSGTINNARGREVCFEPSESKMQKLFQRMIDSSIIEKVPGTSARGTKYRLVKVDRR